MNFYEKQARLVEDGIPFAICTVIDHKGSVPAKVGSKMIVLPDGSIFGTIGGAELELNVIQAAKEMLSKKSAATTKEFSLFYRKEGGVDLACGGTVIVFIDVVVPPPHVLICGGGHIGLALSKILDILGYAYTVVDDRPEFGSKERFSGASEIFEELPEKVTGYDCIVVATYGQEKDYNTLLSLHKTGCAVPILLIGSKAKWKDFSRRLEKDGVGDGFLSQINCPCGLQIHAGSVPEISLSMAGWIVDYYRAKARTE